MDIKQILSDNASKIIYQDAQNAFISKIPVFVNCYNLIPNCDPNEYTSKLINITNNIYPRVNALHLLMFLLSKKYPNHINSFLHAINVACNYKCDANLLERLGNDIVTCLKRFPNLVSDEFYKNFEEIIIPQAKRGNSVFSYRGTRWFDDHKQKGGTGLADFSYKCYAIPVSSSGLHELTQMYKELPAGNFESFEQIRKDAILIGHHGAFGAGVGDMIHNSDLNVKALISGMLQYYNTQDKSQLLAVQSKTDFNIENVFNLADYNQLCENGETAVSVLQRLNTNLNEAKLHLPNVQNKELQTKIELLNTNLKTKHLEDALHTLNECILQDVKTHKIGISPNIVQCCVWMDAKITNWFNKMDFEGEFGLNGNSIFKEVLLFNELLNNPDFTVNQAEFEKFYNDEVISNPTEIAFRAVAQRQNEHVIKLNKLHDKLKELYSIDNEIVFNRKQRIWSGNMFGALQRLLPYKKASTILGGRYRKEREELDANMYSIIARWNCLIK